MKQCPDCAESIQDEARVCRFCGFRFEDSPREQSDLIKGVRHTGQKLGAKLRELADEAKQARALHRRRVAGLNALATEIGLTDADVERAARFVAYDETPEYLLRRSR